MYLKLTKGMNNFNFFMVIRITFSGITILFKINLRQDPIMAHDTNDSECLGAFTSKFFT